MTTPPVVLLGMIPAAYLAGSIPFGLLVGLSKGIDPRKAGSGNIGATNVGRLLGGKFFAIVFVLDLLKGFLPVLAAGLVLRAGSNNNDPLSYTLWLLVGFAAIFGHMFSAFIKFKGGKGVATSAGVVLGVYPFYTIAAVVALLAFGIVLKTTRYMSVASMLGAAAFTLAYVGVGFLRHWDMFGRQLPLLVFAVLMTVMIVVKHRGNVARLRAGTENRLARKTPKVDVA